MNRRAVLAAFLAGAAVTALVTASRFRDATAGTLVSAIGEQRASELQTAALAAGVVAALLLTLG